MSVEFEKSAHHRWLMVWPLVGILVGVYAFTFSGRIESGDTRTLFNATSSMVDFGDLLLDKTSADNPPFTTTPASVYPLSGAEVEPLQLILTAPLYWLAEHIPGIGLVHAVWFFNIFICTAIAVVVYIYALTLGYRPLVGVTTALLLGLGTILWPYSKTFFREPLACLFILLAALSMERWRSKRYRSIAYLIASILALAAAFLAKEAVIFALPALVIIIFPSTRLPKRILKLGVIVFTMLVCIFILSTVFASSLPFPVLYQRLAALFHRSPEQIATVHHAFHTYLLSVGGSVWGTSPVLLLAIPGLIVLYRRQEYRYPFAVTAIVCGFALGYAVLRGDHWFGGLSWPPRFMIPVIPFLMLGTLPIFDHVLSLVRRWWVISGVVVICIYSLWVQLSAVSFDWGVYIKLLPPEANGLVEWGGGLNVLRYLRWVLIPTALGRFQLDFAWERVGVPVWPVACFVIIVISGIWVFRLLRKPPDQLPTFTVGSLWQYLLFPVSIIVLVGLGLRSINEDEIYSGANPSLHAVLPLIQSNTHTGDVLLLADNEYEPFFLNHGKLSHPRVISLPDSPGEQPSPEQLPEVRSTNPDVLLLKTSVPLIYNLAQYHSTLWLLADLGPFHPWAVRPVERFMVTHYYPIRELNSEPPDPRIRLIEYSTAHAPDPFAFRDPDHSSDLRFGDSIRLVGFTLPDGLTYVSSANTMLPISLYWQSDAPLSNDYTVAYFVADSNGNKVAQGADTQPAWGFAPTSSWKPGIPQWDNRALLLPANIPAGEYSIWLRLYQSNDSSLQLPVTAGNVKDITIGILPVKFTVVD